MPLTKCWTDRDERKSSAKVRAIFLGIFFGFVFPCLSFYSLHAVKFWNWPRSHWWIWALLCRRCGVGVAGRSWNSHLWSVCLNMFQHLDFLNGALMLLYSQKKEFQHNAAFWWWWLWGGRRKSKLNWPVQCWSFNVLLLPPLWIQHLSQCAGSSARLQPPLRSLMLVLTPHSSVLCCCLWIPDIYSYTWLSSYRFIHFLGQV